MNKKKSDGFIRPVLLGLAGLLGVLAVLIMVLSLVKIPISLNSYKGLVESTASSALGRTVKVDGDISVTTSLWPVFEIEGLRITNPEGFDSGNLTVMEQAGFRLGVLPLLEGRIHIEEFTVRGLTLNLIGNEQGQVNWIITGPESADADDEVPPGEPVEEHPAMEAGALAMDRLLFERISVSYRDLRDDESLEFLLDRCEGAAPFGEPMELAMTGKILEEPFQLNVDASSLADFLAMTDSRLNVQISVAGTQFDLSGSTRSLADTRSAAASISVSGEDLSSLDDLLHTDLPPLQNYRVGGDLLLETGRLQLNNAEIAVGGSSLQGTVDLNRQTTPPSAAVVLTADTIQLDDFDVDDWSAEPAEETEDELAEPQEPAQASGGQRAEIMSQEVLQRVNALLTVEVGQVLSGTDRLGRGNLKLELQNGRLALEPLQLEVPGGEFLLEASIRPDRTASDASLRVLMQGFDFGVLSRRLNPETDLGGTVNIDIDVQSKAADINDLMANATGYVDVSGQPVNLASGVVDLWAVNLLASVVSSSVEGEDVSQVNCLISRWTIDDGIMTGENLAVDTSKIRICVDGEIDFNERRFNLEAKPRAKRPEFFSLAVPLKVQGEFSDFGVSAKGGMLTVGATAVKFAASPVTTPLRRLINNDLPEDGRDICALPIGPHQGNLEDLPGC